MADRKDILISELALQASSGSQIGRPIRIVGCDELSISFTVSVSAATLQATFGLTGSNDDTRALDYAAILPALITGTTSALPSGATYSAATGLVTFNNLGIGTSEVVMTFGNGFTKYVRPFWTFTSGGGTVSVSATLAAWST